MPRLTQLQDLFVRELQDVLDAERILTKNLPKMAKAAESDELREAFEEHLEQTRGHVDRLERVFEMLERPARAVPCHGIRGIIEEGSDLMHLDGSPAVIDAGLIGAAQKAEHYEIAAYGTLATYAKQLGNGKALDLLVQTLREEKETDQKLSQIAKDMVNLEAAHEARGAGNGGAEEEEEEEKAARPARRHSRPARRR